MRMRGLAGVGVMALMACGGGGDGGGGGTEPPPGGELSASLVGSTQLAGRAGQLIDQDLVVEVKRGGQAASGVTVQFVVTDEKCGKAVAGSVVTDQSGRAKDKWQLGSSTGECKLEVRTVAQSGASPVTRGSFTATVSPGPVTQVSLWTTYLLSGVTRLTVPLGDSVALAKLVRAAADQYGNLVSPVTLQATITKGSGTIRNGHLVSPAAEGAGEIEVKIDQFTGKVPFSVVRDLRDNTWTTSLLCKDTKHLEVGGSRVDSIRWDVTSDSVTYYALADARLSAGEDRGPVASFYFSGRKRSWLASGKVDTTVVTNWRREVYRQLVDTMTVLPASAALFANAPAATPSIRTSNAPVTFTGGTYCPDSTGLKTSPKMVLRAQ